MRPAAIPNTGLPVTGVQYEDGWIVVRKTSKGDVIDGWYATRRHARACAGYRKIHRARRIVIWNAK